MSVRSSKPLHGLCYYCATPTRMTPHTGLLSYSGRGGHLRLNPVTSTLMTPNRTLSLRASACCRVASARHRYQATQARLPSFSFSFSLSLILSCSPLTHSLVSPFPLSDTPQYCAPAETQRTDSSPSGLGARRTAQAVAAAARVRGRESPAQWRVHDRSVAPSAQPRKLRLRPPVRARTSRRLASSSKAPPLGASRVLRLCESRTWCQAKYGTRDSDGFQVQLSSFQPFRQSSMAAEVDSLQDAFAKFRERRRVWNMGMCSTH